MPADDSHAKAGLNQGLAGRKPDEAASIVVNSLHLDFLSDRVECKTFLAILFSGLTLESQR
jgi:hypothetical protein